MLATEAAVGAQGATFGLLSVGDIELAVPLCSLREVVTCPERFDALPASAPGLLGAMALRELVIPVLDVRAILGDHGPDVGAAPIVVVMEHEQRLLGILADQTRDVLTIGARELHAVVGDGSQLTSATFCHPELGSVVSVLDVPALLALPGLPSVRADDTQPAAGAAGGEDRQARRTLTVIGCGDALLALDVADVHTTIGRADVRPSVLDSALCDGVCAFRGFDVPVVDPLVVLGLGRRADAVTSALVVAFEQGYLMLALDQLVTIEDVAAGDILDVPPAALRAPELVAGVALLPDGARCLVLDGDALRGNADLSALAALNTRIEDDDDTATAQAAAGPGSDTRDARTGPMFLTYTAGEDLATALEQIDEILVEPEQRIETPGDAASLGLIVHRHAAIPLLCLKTLLGLPPTPRSDESSVLLVGHGGRQVGFAVDRLGTIDPAGWRQDAGAAPRQASSRAELPDVLRRARLLNVGDSPQLFPDLDLRAIAATVLRD